MLRLLLRPWVIVVLSVIVVVGGGVVACVAAQRASWRAYDRVASDIAAQGAILNQQQWISALPRGDAPRQAAWDALMRRVDELGEELHKWPTVQYRSGGRDALAAWYLWPTGRLPATMAVYADAWRALSDEAAVMLNQGPIAVRSDAVPSAPARVSGMRSLAMSTDLSAYPALMRALVARLFIDSASSAWSVAAERLISNLSGVASPAEMQAYLDARDARDRGMMQAIICQGRSVLATPWLSEPSRVRHIGAQALRWELATLGGWAAFVRDELFFSGTLPDTSASGTWNWTVHGGSDHALAIQSLFAAIQALDSDRPLPPRELLTDLLAVKQRLHPGSMAFLVMPQAQELMPRLAESDLMHVLRRAAVATVLAASATGSMPAVQADGAMPWLSAVVPVESPLVYERLGERGFRLYPAWPPMPGSLWEHLPEGCWLPRSATGQVPRASGRLQWDRRSVIEVSVPGGITFR